MTSISPSPKLQFFDSNGDPLVNAKLYTYAAGTTTLATTYTDAGGGTPNANPVLTDSRGECDVWLGSALYKFVLYTASDALIWTVDNIGGALTQASLSASSGASLIGFIQAGTGAVARTLQAKNRDIVSVKDFGAAGDGVTDDTAFIQAAINAVAVNGGTVFFPAGTYICSGTIDHQPFVYLKGSGIRGTRLQWNTLGAGIKQTSPINSSTPVNTGVYDIDLVNVNASNTDGGYVDVGGTYVYLERVRVLGFKYGIIFDQTELGDINLCELQQQITAGVWLVNGADYTPGAAGAYTNRISVTRTQFNEPATAYCIVDDGGYVHRFDSNNYNGALTHIRNAGQIVASITNSEFESAASTCITCEITTLLTGSGVGQSVEVTIQDNLIIPTAAQSCIGITQVSPINIGGNYFGNSSAAKIVGLGSVFTYRDFGNFSGGGPYSTGTAVNSFIAIDNGTFTPTLTFAVPGDLAVTYAVQIGKYTVVQNRVFYDIVISTSAFTHTTAAGALRVTGLPYACASTSNYLSPSAMKFGGITKAGFTQFNAQPEFGQTFLQFGASASATATAGVDVADVPSAGTVYLAISGSYSVN